MAHGQTPWTWIADLISGDAAGLTWYTDRRGRVVCYPAAPPKEPPSMLVAYQRDRWRRAAEGWRALSPSQRADYKRACHLLHLQATGPGLWLWACCLRDLGHWRTVVTACGLPLAPPIAV